MTKAETDEERRNRKLKELEGKNIADHSVMLSAFVSSRIDANKAVFAFSSAGIAVLATFLDMYADVSTCVDIMYVLALLCLLFAVISTLFVYVAHSNAIESNLRSKDETESHLELKKWVYINFYAFGFGVSFFTIATLISFIYY